jgi:hypothetical protein
VFIPLVDGSIHLFESGPLVLVIETFKGPPAGVFRFVLWCFAVRSDWTQQIISAVDGVVCARVLLQTATMGRSCRLAPPVPATSFEIGFERVDGVVIANFPVVARFFVLEPQGLRPEIPEREVVILLKCVNEISVAVFDKPLVGWPFAIRVLPLGAEVGPDFGPVALLEFVERAD